MTFISQLWSRLDRLARIGLVVCLLLLAASIAAASFWLLRADYQLLFGELTPPDAAAMTAELDRMKVPYRIEGNGDTILVPAEQVYKTRLKLVGRDLPLHGTVGFELFNNADIGMTEFAQKVNYQRALQGELTRTVLSIEEIQSARVHLALPEQTLFKKSASQAKASVSITLKRGRVLQAKQVQGIQRLVAASVPEVREADVTVIDEHGVALTRSASSGADGEQSVALDGKEALERYLNRKVSDVLDRTFGAGQSISSVDVVFSREQTKVTTENVLGAAPGAPTGVIVREHQTGHGTQVEGSEVAPADNREVDYQVGRRVEQTVSDAGAVAKINVAVVVRHVLNADEIEQIRDIVSMAAGIDKRRGDGIAVYSIARFGTATEATAVAGPVITDDAAATIPAAALSGPERRALGDKRLVTVVGGLLAVLVLVVLVAWRWRARVKPQLQLQRTALSEQERAVLLERVRGWIDGKPVQKGDRA